MKIVYFKEFFTILVLALLSLSLFACSGGGNDDDDNGNDDDSVGNDDDSGGNDDDSTTPPTGVIEGEMGLFYVPGVECFQWDAEPREGNDIWVSPSGSDSNDGTNADSPLKTIAQALCHVAPGQTVHLMPGTYNESVLMALFGDASAPITITGVMEGVLRPVLDGQKKLTMGIGFLGDGAEDMAKNVIIENIEFRNYTDQGVLVNFTDNAIIRNNIFDGNGFHSIDPDSGGEGFSLLVTDSTNVQILYNEALNSGPEPALLEKGLLGTAIDTWGCRDVLIQGNHCHHNAGAGILSEEGVNVQILDNEIDHSNLYSPEYLDGGIWLDGGHHVTVKGNYIHDNEGVAIQVSDSEIQFPYASCKYTVTENRIENNWWALYTYNMMQCPFPEEIYLVYENNDVSNNNYTGGEAEYIKGTYENGVLCEVWPCGENQPCVEPENVQGPKVCEE